LNGIGSQFEEEARMKHGVRYEGSFEQNHAGIQPGGTTYKGHDGADHPIAPWPRDVIGMKVGYMEHPGKKFAAVRVKDEKTEVILENPVLIDPSRHMGNRRFGAEPTMIDDEPAGVLLMDLIERNPKQSAELKAIRDRLGLGRRQPKR
jgi:hypothetical protein